MGIDRLSLATGTKIIAPEIGGGCAGTGGILPLGLGRKTELVSGFVRESVGKSDGVVPIHHRHRHALIAVIIGVVPVELFVLFKGHFVFRHPEAFHAHFMLAFARGASGFIVRAAHLEAALGNLDELHAEGGLGPGLDRADGDNWDDGHRDRL